MDNIFRSLTSGLKFNPKNNGKSMKAFSGNDTSKVDLMEALSGKKTKRKMETTNDDDNEIHDDTDDISFRNDEDINAFRNKLNIRVKGDSIPPPDPTFHSMNIHTQIKSIILHNIEQSDWKDPTPIQMQAIPVLLNGSDILASAPTGSGKTAAFVIPILSTITSKSTSSSSSNQNTKGVKSLILVPTKELGEQIYQETIRLSMGKKLKIKTLKKTTASASIEQEKQRYSSTDVLVATPMKLLTAVRNKIIDLSHVQIVILDEVDKLFEHDTYHFGNTDHDSDHEDITNNDNNDDTNTTNINTEDTSLTMKSSFLTQIDEIFSYCPSTCQRGLFSATISSHIHDLALNVLIDPIYINIGTENTGANTIDQKLMFVGREEGKLLAIRQIIQQGLTPPVLIFMQSVDRAKELFRELVYDGINVDVIHSDRTSQQRETVIQRFRSGDIWVLICTDLMARGVDFKGVQMVINYDLPQSAVAYIHRIGRTGRAGRKGSAITLFTEADMPHLRAIANVIKLSGCPVPDWMLSIKKLSTKEKRIFKHKAPERRSIKTDSKYDHQKAVKKKLIITQSKAKKMKINHDGNGNN